MRWLNHHTDDHAKFHQLVWASSLKSFPPSSTTNWFLIFARRSLIEQNWIFSFFLFLTHSLDTDTDTPIQFINLRRPRRRRHQRTIKFCNFIPLLGWSIILPCSLLEALASLWMGWLEDSQSARRKEIEAEQQQQPATKKTRWKDRFSLKRSRPATEKKERKPKLSNWIFPRLLPALHDDRFNIFVCARWMYWRGWAR